MKQIIVSAVVAVQLACTATPSVGHIPENRHLLPLTVVAHPVSDGRRSDSWCAAHLRRGETVQALFDCDDAVAKDPRNVEALLNRGSLFLITRDAEKALADFDTATRIMPGNSTSYYNRGLARARLGHRQQAIEDYSRAIELNPAFAIAYHNRGYEYEMSGERAKALADYQRALRLEPGLKPSVQGLQRLRNDP